MANILDYLFWRGDLPLTTIPFNEIDNVILSGLAYADLEGIVPSPQEEGNILLCDAAAAFESKDHDRSGLLTDPQPLLMSAAASRRFGHAKVSDYLARKDVDIQMQFSAVTFHLDNGAVYVAFRGTDNSLVGWREDFNIAFLEETAGQAQAAKYLNHIGKKYDGPIYLGGHSKGGNLAVYAAAFCFPHIRDRIRRVYSNDGPGFTEKVTQMHEYRRALEKETLIIPESSLIGTLLSNKEEREIIKSSAKGIMQHDFYTWQLEPSGFIRTERTPGSQVVDEVLKRWLDTVDDEQREQFVSVVFDSLDASGAGSFEDLNANKWENYGAVLKAILDLDTQKSKEAWATIKKFLSAGNDVLREEAASRWNNWLRQFISDRTEKTDSPQITENESAADQPKIEE